MSQDLLIKLVRHGQSAANVQEFDPQKAGDFRAPLTALGERQARRAGGEIGHDFLRHALVYTSPYVRTRQTLHSLFEGAGCAASECLGVYEDPRLREQDHGYSNVKEQEPLRETHGWFYYRYQGGESPADCYDRVSGFLESMMRQVERKNAARVLIVTHGMALRCFVMRFLHLTVEEFEALENPENGGVVTVGRREALVAPYAAVGAWAATGLRRRDDD